MSTNSAQDADICTWLNDFRKELRDIDRYPPPLIGHTICRVPDRFRTEKDEKDNDYSPLTISIGPIHHGKESLKPMEKRKLAYMGSLFRRTRDETEALDICTRATAALDKIVRDCYREKVEHTKSELLKMLLYDGCFILELFLRYYWNEYRCGDLILLSPWINSGVRRDLTLLENQIPFIVLDRLFQVIKDNSNSDHIDLPSLVDLARCFFKLDRLTSESREFFHLLHLIHYYHSPSSPSEHPSRNGRWKLIHSATKLSNAGVEFVGVEHEKDQKKSLENDQKKRLFDLEFKDGVMKIPQLCIDIPLFRNLIAMEQCFVIYEHYMTSYGLLMNYLVDTWEDVELLVGKKIIPHNFGDYQRTTYFFNNIRKLGDAREFYFTELCEQVDEYYRKSESQPVCCARRLFCGVMGVSG